MTGPAPTAVKTTPGTGEPRLAGPRARLGGHIWSLRGRAVDVSRPVVMGIVNLTPDSFWDGGSLASVGEALDRARRMVREGAGMLDVGGESTRPGAEPISVAAEKARVLPFLDAACAELPVPITVDTRKAEVADAALQAGAAGINDVSALAYDDDMADVVARQGAGLVLMHMRGDPRDMASLAAYGDLQAEVAGELGAAARRAEQAGIAPERIVVDPGIGFAKNAAHSLELLRDLTAVRALGFPVLVGASRKSFLGAVLDVPASERLPGSLAACVAAYLQGARIFRVHDVAPTVQALSVIEAIMAGSR